MTGARRGAAPARRGAILVVAMALVAATAAGALALAGRTRAGDEELRAFRDRALLAAHLRSAHEVAARLLLLDDPEVDGRTDLWAQPLAWREPDGTEIEVEIRDEAARFPIDRLFSDGRLDLSVKSEFEWLLGALGLSPGLLDLTADYFDPDREPFPAGDEGPGYARRAREEPPGFTPAPIAPPDRPMRVPEEVLDLPFPDRSALARLAEVVTTWTDGTINVNTAPSEVIAARGRFDLETAEAIARRAESLPFRSLDELRAVPGVDGVVLERLAGKAATKSDYFRIVARARRGGVEGEAVRIVLRREGRIETMGYRGI